MKAKLVDEHNAKVEYPLPDKKEVTIGSGQTDDIVIKQHSVAPKHAKITYFKGQYAIWNLSDLGTYVNGTDIRSTDLNMLENDDKIRFGSYCQMKFILEK